MRIVMTVIGLMSIMLVGCTNVDESSQDNQGGLDTQPIHYDTRDERYIGEDREEISIGEKGGYPQSQQKRINAGDKEEEYSDPFTNEETQFISSELKKKKDILQAQVASTDDRIVVAVMLRRNFNDNIRQDVEEIERQVKEIVPNTDKEIVVYTDGVEWNRMKDVHAKFNSDGNIGDLFENLLNPED